MKTCRFCGVWLDDRADEGCVFPHDHEPNRRKALETLERMFGGARGGSMADASPKAPGDIFEDGAENGGG